jgi:iron complex outermembrane receptor protein
MQPYSFMHHKNISRTYLRHFVCCLSLLTATSSFAQTGPTPATDFTTYSIEELMNIELVSAAKKPQTTSESAAAVFVITQEDIRRSGAVNLPEVLRMAPGIQVLRSEPGDFAVTSRGFLGEFANKLLVLIDGRSIYSPLFSGTFWEYNDMLLEDIEQIEVIRGPGAALWGANAVNGVINIITKKAQDTQAGMAVATVSNTEGYDGLRYGIKVKEGMYLRAYSKYIHMGGVVNNKQLHDPRQVNGGTRLDWDMTDKDKLLVTAGYFDGKEKAEAARPVLTPSPVRVDVVGDSSYSGGHALCRWDHAFSTTSDMHLQAFYDGVIQTGRRSTAYKPAQESSLLRKDVSRTDVWDIDFQHSFAAGDRNSIIWGLNARYNRAKKRDRNIFFSLQSETEVQRLYSAFVQDEIQLVPNLLHLTVGSKFEYNSYTQLEVQPSIRMLYTPSDRHSFWTAVSRAVRTPSTLEAHGLVNSGFIARGSLFPLSPPGIAQLQGSEDYHSENLIAYETGYRFNLLRDFSLDTALYYNVYNDLRTLEPAGMQTRRGYFIVPVSTDNNMHGRTCGAETTANWQVLPQWRLQASYSYLRMNLTPEKKSRDSLSEYDEDMSSQHLCNLRSLYSITPTLECDISLYFVDNIERLNNPSYTDLTVRVGWKPLRHLTLEGIGYNLIDNKYKGFRDEIYNRGLNEVRRAFYGRITVAF